MRQTRLTSLLPVAALVVGVVAVGGCFKSEPAEQLEKAAPVKVSPPLVLGTYDIQTIAYDDADGAYRVFLLNPPAGAKPLYTTTELQLARLSDEEMATGVAKPRLVVDETGTTGHIPTDFAIQYVHNEVEERDGQTVVVQQQRSTWSPFMSMVAGAAIGNMLFAPRYYYPPPYVGGAMSGFGGSGVSRSAAATSFTQQHGKAPQATRLSQSGYSKAPSSSLKSTGKGVGSSRMKPPPRTGVPRSKGSFGRGGFGRRR